METVQQPSVGLDQRFIPLMTRFGDAFAGERIWLRELLQNSRRAGASRISILTDPSDPSYLRIEDNGAGISDFQVLLDPGYSNWNEEVLEQDLPFGVGFWSAIDIARRVEVCSKGWRGIFQKDRILAGEQIPFEPCEERQGTTITAHLKKPLMENVVGLDLRSRFRRLLEELICGFPVPVYLDGQPLARRYALDVWDGSRYEFSEAVALVQIQQNGDTDRMDMTFFQGLPLGNESWRHGRWPSVRASGLTVYLHLIGSGWRIKAPDRIGLYESQEVSKKIQLLHAAITRAVGEDVVRLGNGKALFDHLIDWGCADLIREFPIPPHRSARITAPLHLHHYEGDHQEECISNLPAEEIPTKNGSHRFLLADSFYFYPDDTNIAHHFAAYAFGLRIVQTWNDPGHWIWSHPKGETFEKFLTRRLKVGVRPTDKIAEGEWRGRRIVICKAYYLQIAGYGKKRLEEDSYLDGVFYIIGGPYRDIYPIDQAESFQTEREDFDQSEYDLSLSDFRSRLGIIKKDYGRLIVWALEKYEGPLRGLKFTLEGKEMGIDVKEIASHQ